jgi:hypothetical protein
MDKILVFTIAMLAFVVQAEAAMHGGGGHGGGGHMGGGGFHGGGFHGGGFHGGGGIHGGFHGDRRVGRGFRGGPGWYPCNPALLTLGQCPYEYGY